MLLDFAKGPLIDFASLPAASFSRTVSQIFAEVQYIECAQLPESEIGGCERIEFVLLLSQAQRRLATSLHSSAASIQHMRTHGASPILMFC